MQGTSKRSLGKSENTNEFKSLNNVSRGSNDFRQLAANPVRHLDEHAACAAADCESASVQDTRDALTAEQTKTSSRNKKAGGEGV